MTSTRNIFTALSVSLVILLLVPLGRAHAQYDEDAQKVPSTQSLGTAKAKLHHVHKRKLHARAVAARSSGKGRVSARGTHLVGPRGAGAIRSGVQTNAPLREAILLKDLRTGQILFEQRARELMPPASLTKIMSAIVILSEGTLDDSVIISPRAAAAAPTKLYLKPGQIFPLRGLLEAMLIRSANDACLAAAEHIAGTEEAFVVKMNAKAKELGLVQTQFQNACGFNMDRHYSTAEELATLTEYAMRYDTFSMIVKEPMAVLRPVNQSKVLVAHTTNHLLGVMDGVIGVKTGYTRAAGRCLITVIRRGDKELLLVLLNSRKRWSTAQTLLEVGLRNAAPPLNDD